MDFQKITPAFLVVDLLNNANELFDEDTGILKTKIKSTLPPILLKKHSAAQKNMGKSEQKVFR